MISRLFNDDFKDFLKALNDAEVRYIIVGGYAVVMHGHSRNTGDLGIWVERTAGNYQRLAAAFRIFGMPVFDMTETNFLDIENFDVFSFGVPPVCIEILTALKGLEFEAVFSEAGWQPIDGFEVRVISKQHLIAAKKAADRPKDWNDIENLQ